MAQGAAPEQSAAINEFVNTAIQQYRQKLLDLSSRNPLISFRHSEKSRSHLRVVDEIPEILFSKLLLGRVLTFVALAEPELVSLDEQDPSFQQELRKAKKVDEQFLKDHAELGPNP